MQACAQHWSPSVLPGHRYKHRMHMVFSCMRRHLCYAGPHSTRQQVSSLQAAWQEGDAFITAKNCVHHTCTDWTAVMYETDGSQTPLLYFKLLMYTAHGRLYIVACQHQQDVEC